MKLPLADLFVFLIYLVGIVLLGVSFFWKNREPDQYTSGGASIPSWLVGMSIFATFVSSISFIALPGKAYQSNWNAFVFSLSIPVAAYMAVRFFIPLYRSINSISAYTYLEMRFGAWARIYASSCYILTQIMRAGSILYLLALPLHAMLGWSIAWIIIITSACIILYSMMGGIQAVIWTDAIQGFVLIGGAITCTVILLLSMPEGPEQLFAIASSHEKFSLGSLDLNFTQSTFWVVLIYGLFINLQNYGIDQNYVQRYMTTRTERSAKRSALFGSLLYIPVSLLFFFIGTALYAYYSVVPDLLPASLKTAAAADNVFPYYIVHELPPGVTGLLIAAIVAAGMSTVSTSINSVSTIVLTDFYKKYFSPQPSVRSAMRVLYGSSFVFGIVSIIVALAMIRVKSALDAWWTLASVFSGGMLGLFLLAYFVKTITRRQAMVGVIAGVLIILWMSLSPVYFSGDISYLKNPLHPYVTIVVGTTVIFLTGFFLSLLRSKEKKELIETKQVTIE